MPILTREIARRIKGSLQDREDWWRLCYDTESREFHIEHEWHHMDAFDLSKAANAGETKEPVEGYRGEGEDKIEEAKAALLEEAGHA